MHRWAAAVLAILLAGCSGGGSQDDGGGPSGSSTSTGPSGPPLPPPPPFVDVRDNMELRVSLAGNGIVHRVRLFAFDDFALDSVAPSTGDGMNNPPQPFGIALFGVDQSPANAPACSEAPLNSTWDGRATPQDPDWSHPSGVYDLWLWSSSGDGLVLVFNGGGSRLANVTALPYNWTATELTPTLANSGPAQTVISFSTAIPVVSSALIVGGFTPPNGYPDEQASTTIESGAVCDEASGTTPPGGGGGGGGGGFNNPRLAVAAYVGKGDATWSGRFTAAVTPMGSGTVGGVALAPS